MLPISLRHFTRRIYGGAGDGFLVGRSLALAMEQWVKRDAVASLLVDC
jgi:hypothetical protein